MRLGRTLGRYLIGVVLIVVLICAGITVRIVQFAHAGPPHRADVAVVLGAAQYNGTPSPVFRARLDHAAELYANNLVGHIVTVGGNQPGDRTTEAEAGRQYLAAAGIADTALTAVPTGHDTLVSLRAAARVMRENHWYSVILVTDPWHEQRCRMIARDLGFAVQVSPVHTGPATGESIEPRYVWRELQGSVFYRLLRGSSGEGTPVL